MLRSLALPHSVAAQRSIITFGPVGEPETYLWDFDRSAWDSKSGASTFSVGIYQWLPTTSGKGLKKSKTIRVLGYVAEPERAYAKAQEVCDRLNREDARFEALPNWVQKQYSVPKPAGFAPPARNTLSAAEARKIRNRVVKQRLLPAGFIQSHASTFVRRVGEIVQAINFQTMTWGPQFTVNLGLHYTFTPPVGSEFRRIPWTTLDYVKCSMRARVGHFLPEKRDTWFPFGNDSEELVRTYRYCIEESVRALDHYTGIIENPAALLPGGHCNSFPPFLIGHPTVFFATIEMRLNQLDDAERRLQEPLDPSIEGHYRPLHRRLLKDIDTLRREGLGSKRAQEMLTWVTD